jgi:hypothetical protein
MRIIFLPEALDYFNELSTILFEKNYFGFEKDALEYVDDFVNDIKTTLPNRQKRLAPSYFERYGKDMHYATFKKINKHSGMYSSQSTNTKANLSMLSGTSVITI